MIPYTFRLYIAFLYLLPTFYFLFHSLLQGGSSWWKRKRNTDSVALNGSCCYWEVLIMAWNMCFSCRCLSLKTLQAIKPPSVEWKTQWICSSFLSMKLCMIIYMFQCYSLKSSHPHLLPQSPKVCSLPLCLFCCLTYRITATIFLNSIYMHYYTVLVFLLLTYFTLYNRLQFHLPH